MNHELEMSINRSLIETCTGVNLGVKLFTSQLEEIANKHAPMNKLKVRECAPTRISSDYSVCVDGREHWTKKIRKNTTSENFNAKIDSIIRTSDQKIV